MPTLVRDKFRHGSQTRHEISELSLKGFKSLIKSVDFKLTYIVLYSYLDTRHYWLKLHHMGVNRRGALILHYESLTV
jgi:hypothetical protein